MQWTLEAKNVKICCDTSVMPGNIKGNEPKSVTEREAMEWIKNKFELAGSNILYVEIQSTPDETQREFLTTNYVELTELPLKEKVLGFHSNFDQYRGGCSFPLVSVVQDETIFDKLTERVTLPRSFIQF